MRVLLVAVTILMLAGCGEEPKPVAAPTPTPTTPAPTATATPTPAGDERAQARLLDWLQSETSARGRQCSPAGKLTAKAIAAMDCEYDGESDGSYLLFKTRADMRSHFNRLRRGTRSIGGTRCSYRDWYRGKRKQGRLAFVKVGAGKVLLWTEDSERVVGTISGGLAPAREVCAIWTERA